MKLPIIWSIIGIAVVVTAAPASINKHDTQVDISTVLARDTMTPPQAFIDKCVKQCRANALKAFYPITVKKARKECPRLCSGHKRTKEVIEKEKEKEKENAKATTEQPKVTGEKSEEDDLLTFNSEEEWNEWLKENKDYEELTPP